VTASTEAATGVALLVVPVLVVSLLFGGSLDTPTALVVVRVTGAALLSLGSRAGWRAMSHAAVR